MRDNELVVEVADDGCGFNSRERQAGSDGIVNMKERLHTLGGGCEITSLARKGTTVQFHAPLPGTFL